MIARMIVLAGLFLASTCALAAEPDAIVGVWETAEGDYIEIYKAGEAYEGTLVGGSDSVGTTIIEELAYQEDNVWDDGTIHDPDAGESYDVMATLHSPEELEIRGYLGSPAMGESFTWTAVSRDAEGVQQDALQ